MCHYVMASVPARALDYRGGGPVLVNEMAFASPEKEPLELTIARYRADLYTLSYDLRPAPA
jgi:GntR family transcriptional regulator